MASTLSAYTLLWPACFNDDTAIPRAQRDRIAHQALDRTANLVAAYQCTHVAHYVVTPEAVANLLRLPHRRGNRGEWLLTFTQFDGELRFVPIILTAEPLPVGLTCTAAGIAVVGLTGTRAEILAANERQLERVEAFLVAKLAEFAR
jgi:F0F1-type ATP synthase membrane subunit c/vacuolar-type H+-ATPase subunit K